MGDATRPDQDGQESELGRRWSSRLAGIRLVAANRSLRRLAAAWGLFNVAEYAIVVALGVYAFSQGGTLAVGLVALTRTLPGLISGPLAAVAADRWRRGRLLVVGLAGRSISSAAIVAFLVSDQPYLVYTLAAIDAILASSFWPAMAALTAEFSREPDELTAANATAALMENLGTLVGPLMAGGILVFAGSSWVFGLASGLFGLASIGALRLRSNRVPHPPAKGTRLREVAGGWMALRAAPDAAWVVALWGLESLALGALDVVVVVYSIDVLGLGDSGVGYLSAASGAGGVVAAGMVSVISQRSGRLVVVGVLTLGASLLLVGAFPYALVVGLAMGLAGAAAAWVDVGAQTLLQRMIPDHHLGRVLGLFEGVYWAALGLGGLVGSALILATSPMVGVAVLGGAMATLAMLLLARMGRIDNSVAVPAHRLAVLRAMSMLARLPTPTLERLARRSEEIVVEKGTAIIRQGDLGDRFYVIASGRVEVDANGEELARLGPGDGFGEVALLEDQPRNADVVSLSTTHLVSIPGVEFVEAVTGHSGAADAAAGLVAARLAGRAARHRSP